MSLSVGFRDRNINDNFANGIAASFLRPLCECFKLNRPFDPFSFNWTSSPVTIE